MQLTQDLGSRPCEQMQPHKHVLRSKPATLPCSSQIQRLRNEIRRVLTRFASCPTQTGWPWHTQISWNRARYLVQIMTHRTDSCSCRDSCIACIGAQGLCHRVCEIICRRSGGPINTWQDISDRLALTTWCGRQTPVKTIWYDASPSLDKNALADLPACEKSTVRDCIFDCTQLLHT